MNFLNLFYFTFITGFTIRVKIIIVFTVLTVSFQTFAKLFGIIANAAIEVCFNLIFRFEITIIIVIKHIRVIAVRSKILARM